MDETTKKIIEMLQSGKARFEMGDGEISVVPNSPSTALTCCVLISPFSLVEGEVVDAPPQTLKESLAQLGDALDQGFKDIGSAWKAAQAKSKQETCDRCGGATKPYPMVKSVTDPETKKLVKYEALCKECFNG